MKNSKESFMVLFMFAGHGFINGTGWSFPLNEYDANEGYYKLVLVEQILRTMAELKPKYYIVGIFVGCRQIYTSEFKYISKDEKERRITKELRTQQYQKR